MATYTQSSSSVSSAYQNFFLSKVPDGSDYLIFATDDYYCCVYGTNTTGTNFTDSTVIKISRAYNQSGTVTYTNESSTSVSIGYEYYSYSNVGTGTYIADPQYQEYNNVHNNLQTSLLFVILLVIIGFNVVRKRWIDTK